MIAFKDDRKRNTYSRRVDVSQFSEYFRNQLRIAIPSIHRKTQYQKQR